MKALIVCGLFMSIVAPVASAAADPATTFSRKCSSCHTFGKGILVGPDLKGVTGRHKREWLVSWITSSETVIRSRDRDATALFGKFKQQRMPDQSLSPAEIAGLLDYLAAGGPEIDARKRDRRADTATAAEIETGHELFVGQRPLANGGGACVSCHRVGDAVAAGGTLGPDLLTAYARYQDKGLAALLAKGCFPRAGSTADPVILTDEESFALRAFLHHEMRATR
jgi:mono/diheme cytochrome c family protein